MREILFRGKSIDNGEWVEGTIHFNGKYILSNKHRNNYHEWVEIIPETVGQYTGMIDKNGVKIFEGDIIKVNHNSEYINSLYCEWEDCNACFVFVDKKDFENRYYLNLNNLYKDEVIGNIHDNKELLK